MEILLIPQVGNSESMAWIWGKWSDSQAQVLWKMPSWYRGLQVFKNISTASSSAMKNSIKSDSIVHSIYIYIYRQGANISHIIPPLERNIIFQSAVGGDMLCSLEGIYIYIYLQYITYMYSIYIFMIIYHRYAHFQSSQLVGCSYLSSFTRFPWGIIISTMLKAGANPMQWTSWPGWRYRNSQLIFFLFVVLWCLVGWR